MVCKTVDGKAPGASSGVEGAVDRGALTGEALARAVGGGALAAGEDASSSEVPGVARGLVSMAAEGEDRSGANGLVAAASDTMFEGKRSNTPIPFI